LAVILRAGRRAWPAIAGGSSPVCPDDSVAVWGRVPADQATKAASLDLLHEPDLLVAVSRIGTWEPVTEPDARRMLVGEQDHNVGVVARARDPHLEVVGDPRDEGSPLGGGSGQRFAAPSSSPKPLQILVLLLVAPAP